MEDLKRLKFTRPRDIRAVLASLPQTLDETYNRILKSIDSRYHQEAITALTWLALSVRPLTLDEVAEACILDHRAKLHVDEENRFPPEGILEILGSLVTEVVGEDRDTGEYLF